MIRALANAFAAGLLFGSGLIVSGMADPGKVIGFLDVAGRWDPSLALVMAAAVAFSAAGIALGRLRVSSRQPAAPARQTVDRSLLMGAMLFGIGWGLAGICPGPALVLAGAGFARGIAFLAAMLAGMALFRATAKPR